MAQIRRFNWLDDDLTVSLNKAVQSSIQQGRYHGFSWDNGSSLTANFIHTIDGFTIVNSDSSPITTTNSVGEWKTKQGGVIQETAPIQALFAANPSGNPRIDLLVGQHQYVQSAGGAVATYVVIQGTAAATPLIPNLTLPNEQTILGQMFIPAGAIDLSNAIYTRATTPNFAGDNTIAHTERLQTFTEQQVIPQLSSEWGVCYLDATTQTIYLDRDKNNIALSGDALRRNIAKNKFIINNSVPSTTVVLGISPYPYHFLLECKNLEFFSTQTFTLDRNKFKTKGYNIDTPIDVYSSFSLATIEDSIFPGTLIETFVVTKGGEALLNSTNVFQRINAWNKTTKTIGVTGILPHSNEGNFVEVTTSPSSSTIKAITPSTLVGGTFLIIRSDSEPLTLVHNSVDSATKKLWLPNLTTITSRSNNEVFLFVEDVNYWRLVGTYDRVDNYHYVGDATNGLGTTMVDYTNTGGGDPLKFRKMADGKLHITGHILKNILTNQDNIVFTLPTGYRPFRGRVKNVSSSAHRIDTGVLVGSTPAQLAIGSNGVVSIISYALLQSLSVPAQQHAITNVFIDAEISLE